MKMVTPSNLTIDATTGPFDVFIGWLRCMISSNLLTFRSGEKIGAYHMYKQGNIGIAGHRDGFFRGLKDVHLGEYLDLYTERGNTRYIVDEIRIVPPEDVSVLAPRPRSSITLVTCYPFYFVGSAPLRYIVHASTTSAINLRAPRPRIHSKDRGVRDSSSAGQSTDLMFGAFVSTW